MWEFIIFIIVFLFLRQVVHSIPKTRLRKRLLKLTQLKLSYQDGFVTGNADYYRVLFAEIDAVVNQMCRSFTSVNVLYQQHKIDSNIAEMFYLDWNDAYLLVGIDVAEKYRQTDLLRSLFAHELAHYEMRHLHLLQTTVISYLYDAIYLVMFWYIYQNYRDLWSVGLVFLMANFLMLIWKLVYRALLRRNEYKCDELSLKFFPNGCLPFMEHEFLSSADDASIRDGSLRRLSWWEWLLFLKSTHPPKAERIRRLRAKVESENPSFETTRL